MGEPTQAHADPLMMTGNGQSDTHAKEIENTQTGEVTPNPHPKAGQDYSQITGREIAKMAADPAKMAKARAPWFIPSTYASFDARGHEAQRERGLYHVLPVDIDKGGPSLEQVEEATKAVIGAGTSHIIYSSSSATEEQPKWRVLVFLAEPVTGADYRDTQEALFDLYAERGIECDYALARTGQLVFLPNVPPEKRDQLGTPNFYHHRLNRGNLLFLGPDNPIIQHRENVRKEIAETEAEIARLKSQSRAVVRADDDSLKPGEIFNQRHDLADLMTRYGYVQLGKSKQWKSPHQTSGSYAVRIFDEDRWVSLSGSDQAAGIGNGKDYCCWGDAFDLFVFFEHNNDHKAAVRAYGREVNPTANVVQLNPEQALKEDFGSPKDKAEVSDTSPKPKANGGGEDGLTAWVFLSGDNDFYHMPTGRIMNVTAFNLSMTPLTPPVEIIKKDGEVAEKKFPPAKTLIEFLDGHVAHSTMYRPDVGVDRFSFNGIPFVNSYRDDSVPNADEGWQDHQAWKVCRDHVHNILGDDATVIIQWMAHNVQNPGTKILWAPIIVGVQGDGKTTLAKILAMAMGVDNVSPVSPEAMFSEFTGWAEGACVKVLEEIRVHGNSRHNAMNKLKPLITNDTVEIVRKGKDGKQVINVTNYMALTNYMDALALDDGDRRWGVFKTKFEDRTQMLAEFDDAYWEALHGAISQHPEVIRGWLKSVDLTGFNRVAGPEINSHKEAMISSTRSPDQVDVEEAIEIGWHGVAPTALATDCLNSAILNNTGQRLNGKRLSTALEAAGWVKVDGTIKWSGKNRRVWRLKSANLGDPTTAELRAILDTGEGGNDADF